MANQHNANRAHVPLVNVVGDHADYHLKYDAPLTSDVRGHCELVSHWVGVAESADDLAAKGAEAIQQSLQNNGQIASLIAPANFAWETASVPASPLPLPQAEKVDDATIKQLAAVLSTGRKTALFLGGRSMRAENLDLVGRIAQHCQGEIFCETFPARLQRGVGRVPVKRFPYFAEQAVATLQAFEQIILIGSKSPVAFFAHPGKPSDLVPETCETHTLVRYDQNIGDALQRLVDKLGADQEFSGISVAADLPAPEGELTPAAIGQTLTRHLPAGCVVSDEAATCGLAILTHTQQAAPHDWLILTGGAIGQGLPVALGAAIACPEQKVIALQADGSGMYTIQALWSMVREQVDVTVVVMNNHSYAILAIELARVVGAGKPTPKTLSMLSLANPDLSFVDMARGMGMPATLATTAEEFEAQFSAAMDRKGPQLIECMVIQHPQVLG